MPPSPPSTEPIAAPPPATRGLVVAVLRWLVIGSSTVVGLAIVLWLVLQWAILPRIEVWRPAIEQRASEALGVPVSIGVIRAVDSGIGWTGAFEMEQMVLLDPQTKQEALRLPRVRAALSATSLYPGWDGVWRLRLRQLVLDEPELEIRRDAQGRLWVAGLDVGAARGDGEGALADWFFSQREFLIRGGRVQWIDASLDVAPLVLSRVDLVLRNGVRRHAFRLDATPPAPWGERWSLRGNFTQPLLAASPLAAPASGSLPAHIFSRPGDWQRWQGTLYAELPAIDLAPIQPYLAASWAPTQGLGALRAWVDVRGGRLLAATADLELRNLSLRLAPEREPLTLARIGGRLAIKHDPAQPDRDEGWSVEIKQLGFATAAGPEWPAADGRLAWRRAADGSWTGGELVAPRLDLGRLSQALTLVPADWMGGSEFQALAASFSAQGEAADLEARWSGPLLAPQRYRVKAQLRGLVLAPAESPAPDLTGHIAPTRPGVQGADIALDVTETGGDARISVRDGALTFPGVFAQPRIELAALDTTLEWRIQPKQDGAPTVLEIDARDLRFNNADMRGEFDLKWTRAAATPAATLGVIDLSGKLTGVEAIKVPRYLPLTLSAGVRDYLGRALQGGRASEMSLSVRGPLAEFPFATPPVVAANRSPAGEFRLAAQVEGVRFAYLPADPAWNGDPTDLERRPWPAFNDVKGELVFDRESLQLRKLGGRLGAVGSGGLVLRDLNGGIRDIGAADPVLAIDGNVRGPLDDLLRYIDATPVGGWLGDALVQATATVGTQQPIDLQLGLTIPLNDDARTQVRGRLQIAGNDLKLRPDLPLLGAARGRIDFTERSFTLSQAAASVLGGEAQFDGGFQPDGSMRFNVQGSASAEGIRRTSELGALSNAARILTGQTSYRVALGFVRDQVEWQFSSSLAGLGVDLPAPLGKSAEPALPLRVQVGLQPATAAGALQRDTLRVDLGPDGARVLQAQYLRELAPGGARVLRGGLAVGTTAGEALPQPARGVTANLAFSQLDLAAWQRAADALSPAASADSKTSSAADGYLPDRLNLRAQSFTVGGYPLTAVKAALSRSGDLWALDIDATEVAGRAEYRPPGAAQAKDAGRVMARLARLSIPRGADDPVQSVLNKTTAASLPAIDIVIDDFELRGKRLGRLEIDAVNRSAEGPDPTGSGEWQLKRLRLVTPQDEALFNGTGRWAAPVRAGEPRRVVLDFTLEVADSGALLARLGQADVIKGAKGSIGGQVDWLGSPLALDYPSLSGQMTLNFDRGQFLQADPGAAKLLGVLSLQSLPRRLLLDFKDVFEKGFAFDSITGDVSLARGLASTSNLKMRGVQATVLMEGATDVQLETQDLHVWVVPEINANAASLAYIAINPVVGIGAFLAQLFLQRPLAAAATREFHVTGPWAAPLVVPVVRTSPDAGSPPAASAPGARAP